MAGSKHSKRFWSAARITPGCRCWVSQKGDSQLELLLLSSSGGWCSFGCWTMRGWDVRSWGKGGGWWLWKGDGATQFGRCVVRGLEKKKWICLNFRIECNFEVSCAFGRELNQMIWKCLLQPELFSDWFYSFVMAFTGYCLLVQQESLICCSSYSKPDLSVQESEFLHPCFFSVAISALGVFWRGNNEGESCRINQSIKN